MEITKYDNYLEELYKEFPDVDKDSIKRLVRHGLFMITVLRAQGMDIYINDNRKKHYYYFGDVVRDKQDAIETSNRKLKYKLRYRYRARKEQYDGYYYFLLDEETYEDYTNKKPITVPLYKVREEALTYKKGKYLFRKPIEEPTRWLLMLEGYTEGDEELIERL